MQLHNKIYKKWTLSLFVSCLLTLPAISHSQPSSFTLITKTKSVLSALGINSSTISIYKDSTRYSLKNGDYFDLFFQNKKLNNLRKYNKAGIRIDSSSFKDGNGFIYHRKHRDAIMLS